MHPDYARAQRWALDCEAGRCRYADVACPERDLSWRATADSTTHCGGYRGTICVEQAQLVSRWRPCDRQVAWWDAERARRAKERGRYEEAKARGKG